MNPVRLFTSFDGRIGRRAYWLGLFVLIAASPYSVGAVLSSDPFREAAMSIRRFGIAGLGWSIVLLLSLAALNTKRLHDQGRSGLLGMIFYLPAALSSVTLFTGWAPPMLRDVQYWTAIVAGLAGATGLWFMAKLGFGAGQRGANRFGPDPRA